MYEVAMKTIQKALKEDIVYNPYNPSFRAFERINAKREQNAKKIRRMKVDVENGSTISVSDVVWIIHESRHDMNHASARPPVIASRIFAL